MRDYFIHFLSIILVIILLSGIIIPVNAAPTEVLSPVIGPLYQTTGPTFSLQYDKWYFWQHQDTEGHSDGYHGIGGANDYYAWDVNLHTATNSDLDSGQPVYAVESGTVAQTFGGALNTDGTVGQVLIDHSGWYSGYVHLNNIQVTRGQSVTKDTILGYISNVGADNNHLHFAVYTGTNTYQGLKSYNGIIQTRSVPVILVHGFREGPEIWDALERKLQEENIPYYNFEYGQKESFRATGNPIEYAGSLKTKIDQLKSGQEKIVGLDNSNGYSGQFDIVCHSMGALVSRWYIEKLDGEKDIHQWIGIAPANHGSALADVNLDALDTTIIPIFLGDAREQLKTDSYTVTNLKQDVTNDKIKYRVFVGSNLKKDLLFGIVKFIPLFWKYSGQTPIMMVDNNGNKHDGGFDDKGWTFYGDGVVAEEQSKLFGSFIERFEGLDHNALPKDSTVISRTIDYLKKTNQYSPPSSTSPLVDTFDVTPQSAQPNGQFTISYTVTDYSNSGLKRIELWRKDGNDKWTEIQRYDLFGVNTKSGSFQNSPVLNGQYGYGVHVVDNKDQWSTESSPRYVIISDGTSPVITGITPTSGINTGSIHITELIGSGFQSGAIVELKRADLASVYAQNVIVVSTTKINCTFNLTGKTAGSWDIVVTNPDGKNVVLQNAFTILTNTSSVGAPNIEWQRCVGGTKLDTASRIISTPDGGSLVQYSTTSTDGDFEPTYGATGIMKFDANGTLSWKKDTPTINDMYQTSSGDILLTGADQSHLWIAKINSDGKTVWSKLYDGTGNAGTDFGSKIYQSSEGGYIVLGSTGSIGYSWWQQYTYYFPWVIKINSHGELEWSHEYSNANEIIETSNGEYFLLGSISAKRSDGGEQTNISVTKIDGTGNIQWNRQYGGTYDEGHTQLKPINNGFVIITYTRSNDGDVTGNHGDADFWFIKADNSGNIIQQKCFGGSKTDFPGTIFSSSDGGFVINGHTDSVDGDLIGLKTNTSVDMEGNPYSPRSTWLFKITSNGEKGKSIIINQISELGKIIQLNDGGYLVTGHSGEGLSDYKGGGDIVVAKISSDLTLEWIKCYGGTNYDRIADIVESGSGKYTLTGYTASNDGDVSYNHGGNGYDIWVAELSNRSAPLPLVISIFPNQRGSFDTVPLSAEITGTGFSSGATVYLRSDKGNLINGTEIQLVTPTKITGLFNLTNADPGYYDLMVTNPDGGLSKLQNGFEFTVITPVEKKWGPSVILPASDTASIFSGAIALDSNDLPHIVFSKNGNLSYAVMEGSQWKISELTNGAPSFSSNSPQIDLDSENNPHISYVGWNSSANSGTLNYTRFTGQTWETKIIDDVSSSNNILHLDSHEKPHIVYTQKNGGKYAYTDGSQWNVSPIGYELATFDFVLDKSDQPHIINNIYTCGWNCGGALTYSTKDPAGWHNQVFSNLIGQADGITLALDVDNNPHISFHKYTQAAYSLNYGFFNGQNWHFNTLSNSGSNPILRLNATDQPMITATGNTGALNYYQYDRKVWQLSTIAPPQPQLYDFILDDNDNPHVLYGAMGGLNYSTTNLIENPNLRVDFFTNTITGSAPLIVQFSDTSSGSPISWNWSFGDGDTTNATKQNPIHTYYSTGNYTVSLTAINTTARDIKTKANYIIVSSSSNLQLTPGSLNSPGPELSTLTPEFSWPKVTGADAYGLYIRDLDTNTLVFDSRSKGISITDTKYSLPAGILENGKKYRWNMNAHTSAGWGGYSDRYYFQAPVPATLLPAPTRVSPGTSSLTNPETTTLTPDFKWQPVAGADEYALYISEIVEGKDNPDPIFNSKSWGATITGTNYTLPSTLHLFHDGKLYMWYMRSHNPDGWGSANANLYFFKSPEIDEVKRPVATFIYRPRTPKVNEDVDLITSVYNPDEEAIDKYVWIIDDKPITTPSFFMTYKFDKTGEHTLKLIAKDVSGHSSSEIIQTVIVSDTNDDNLIVELTPPEKIANGEQKSFQILIKNNGEISQEKSLVKLELPPTLEMLDASPSVFWHDKEKQPQIAYWIIDTPSPGNVQGIYVSVKSSNKKLDLIRYNVTVKKINPIPVSTFYPGIGWEPFLQDGGNSLSSRIVYGYALDGKKLDAYYLTRDESRLKGQFVKLANTGIDIRGAVHVWLASHNLFTDENYVTNPIGDGYHPIIFSHSGGTQTLYKKLESGAVTAKYVFFIAPALLDQEKLKTLIKEGKVEKIFIIQSEKDALFLNKVAYKLDVDYTSSSYHPYVRFLSSGPFIHEIDGDVSELIPAGLINQLPVNPEKFWIGGSTRDTEKATLFTNWDYRNDKEDDIIAITLQPSEIYPNDDGEGTHIGLLNWVVQHYNNGDVPPFDGKYPELNQPLPKSQTASQVFFPSSAHDPNEKTGPEGHYPADEPLHYRVEYENEGDGPAYNVTITDVLDLGLDNSTLEISPIYNVATGLEISEKMKYFPNNRTIFWDIGDVLPGEGGYSNISVKFLPTISDGTKVVNYATVYFPSADEVTKTNSVVTIKGVNLPPDTPNLTYPEPAAPDIPVNGTLLWEGHEPNNETLMYDVYLGSLTPPTMVLENTSSTIYSYTNLTDATTYYWKIVAKDPYGLATASTINPFTTGSAGSQLLTNFTANITSGPAPLTVQFTDTSTGNPASWKWAYRNSTTNWTQFATAQNPVYSFARGTYDINLTVTNSAGADDRVNTSFISVVGTLPGQANPPTDMDGDGLYEDLNGNAALDFNDVQIFFRQMDGIAASEPTTLYDFNHNGGIDFNDIQLLFRKI